MFNTPICLFIFKRGDKASQIIKKISEIKPSKIYLIGDGARNDSEIDDVNKCRDQVENAINWDCEVIKNYAEHNRGVYENIAGGVKWVFEHEKSAIFLEDDNMPELSFFNFCEEMLFKYEKDTRILWICGTNYEVESKFPNHASYTFTQNMMPCGWASWADKFCKFYDGSLSLWENPITKKVIAQIPYNNILKQQDMNNWDTELQHYKTFGRFISWDYQMSFSLRVHNLLGIVPKYNQITNIGVDEYSIHGGTSFENEMTRRFCGLSTKELEFPLTHPLYVYSLSEYEEKIGKIITLPFRMRVKACISRFLKRLFKIGYFESFSGTIRNRAARFWK